MLRDAWRAERRLDQAALQRLAEALQLSVETLACRYCRYRGGTPPRCPACEAANEIDDQLLVPATERVTAFLGAARQSVPQLRRGALRMTPWSWTSSPQLFTQSPEFASLLVRFPSRAGSSYG
ncbi:MAG: hypothetical protein ACRDTE_05810 [Pseudonocardiaceae bacterium]